MNNPNTVPVKTLADIAVSTAIAAVKQTDKATFNAVVSLSLVMVSRQLELIDEGKSIDEAKNKAAFRAFTKSYASRGNVVWRGTEHIVGAIMSRKGKERIDAVNAYIDGSAKGKSHPCDKPEGSKYAEHLSKLRTWSFRLMTDVCTNFQDEIRQIRNLRDGGATAETQADYFTAFVGRIYGDSFAMLAHSLSKDKAAKAKADPVDSILKKAGEMGDAELQRLITGLNQVWAERMAVQAETGGIETGESEGETETTETPESIAA